MNKYASVRPFWIATADALLFENVHYAAHRSEILDLIVHASFINTAIHLHLKRCGSTMSPYRNSAYVIVNIFSTF